MIIILEFQVFYRPAWKELRVIIRPSNELTQDYLIPSAL